MSLFRISKFWCALALLCISFCLSAFSAHFGWVDFDHEGVLFKPALDFVEGKMLFKESFTQYGALSVLIPAAALKVFGPYLLVVKLVVSFLYALTSVLLLLIWSFFAPLWLSFFAAVFWNVLSYHFVHVFLAWSSSFALFFQVLSIFFFLEGYKKGRPLIFFLSGAAAAACIFCKQNVGVYIFSAEVAALLLFLYLEKAKKRVKVVYLGSLVAGLGAFVAAFALWLWSQGAIKDWWLQQFVWPAAWSKMNGGGYSWRIILSALYAYPDPNTMDRVVDWSYRLIPSICLVTLIYLVFTSRRDANKNWWLLAVALFSMASWLQFYPMPGIGHLWWSSGIMFGVGFFVSFKVFERFASRLKLSAFRIASLFILLVVISHWPSWNRRAHVLGELIRTHTERIAGNNPLRGIFVTPEKADYVKDIEVAINNEVNLDTNKEIVLDRREGIYLTFAQGSRFFHPLWPTQYEEVVKTIYPDFPEKLEKYIREIKPTIFTYKASVQNLVKKYPGYEVTGQVEMRSFEDSLIEQYGFTILKYRGEKVY